MRAVAALLTIPGADKHPQLNEFVTQVLQLNDMFLFPNQLLFWHRLFQIKSTPDLASLFESIQKDSGEASSNGMDLSWGGGRRGAGRGLYFLAVFLYFLSVFLYFSFRWGQWECVWDGGCEKKAGWLWTFNGGGPQPSPRTSAPFKKVIAQDFVIFLLKTSCGVSWFLLDYHVNPFDVDLHLISYWFCGSKSPSVTFE